MFNNVGRKIQDVVRVVFVLSVIGNVLLGIAIIVAFVALYMVGIGIILGIAVAGAGIFLAWLGQLRLYAYGKMAQCCEEQSVMMRYMLTIMMQREQGEPVSPAVKKCENCGNMISGGAKFCPVCGLQCE